MTFSRLRPILAAVALTGLAAFATTVFVRQQRDLLEGSRLRPSIDHAARFAPLRPYLAKDDVVGYVTDVRDTRGYYKARWVLSPARVLYDTPREIVVGDFYSPQNTNRLIEQAGYEVIRDCGNGVRLLRRRAERRGPEPVERTERRGPEPVERGRP